jgi:hypothetical protein
LRRPLIGISEDLKAALCPKPCKGPITRSQRRLLPSGDVEVTGELPPPLCDACPERDNPKAPIRHIEVLYGFPPTGDVWGVRDIENAVRIKVVYDDPPESDGIHCRE